MKKLIAVALLCVPILAQAEYWVQTDGDNQNGTFIDRSTITTLADQSRTYWEKSTYHGIDSPFDKLVNQHVELARSYVKFFCADKKYQLLQLIFIDGNDKVIATLDYTKDVPPDIKPIKPASKLEQESMLVCGDQAGS